MPALASRLDPDSAAFRANAARMHERLARVQALQARVVAASEAKRARFEHRLAQRGVPEGALARLSCPVGVPGIAGKQPEIIAIAVVAQLLQVGTAAAAAPADRG